MGYLGIDAGNGIAVDGSGMFTLQVPAMKLGARRLTHIREGGDAFVAKLNISGVLQWNTLFADR